MTKFAPVGRILQRMEYMHTGIVEDTYAQRLKQSGLGGPPAKAVLWGREYQAAVENTLKKGEQIAGERQERAAKDVEMVGAFFSGASMGVLRAMFGGAYIPPTPLEVAYSKNFDPEDPAQGAYVQGWLRDEGKDVKTDGKWGSETVTALMEVVRTERDEALQIETDWIEQNLVDGGYLDQIGDYTVSDLAAAAGDPGGSTIAKMIYQQAVREWAQGQNAPPTLEEARADYIQLQAPIFGLPSFAPVGALKYLVTLPPALAHGVDIDVDAIEAQYGSQQRQRELQRETATASQSNTWWDGTKGALWTGLEAVAWPGEQAGGILHTWGEMGGDYSPTGYGPDILPVWTLPSAVKQWISDPETHEEYEVYRKENPWDAFVLEAVFDPLNYVGVGLVGKGAKVVRAGKKWQTVGGLVGESRLFGMADTALGATAKIEHARPIRWALRKSMSPVGKATRAAAKLDNMAGRQALRAVHQAELAARPLSAAVDATREGLNRLRRTDFGVKPVHGARAVAEEGAEKVGPAFWNDVDVATREAVQTRIREATQSVAASLSDGAPELQRLVDTLGSRLYDDVGNPTPAGQRLQAILSKESFIAAREAATEAGEMLADDLASAHYAGPGVRGDMARDFYEKFLTPAQNEMGAILESLDAYARHQGYEAVVDGPLVEDGGRLLDQALQKRVVVDNPNRPGAYVWTEPAQKERNRLLDSIEALSDRADQLAAKGDEEAAQKLRAGIERNWELVVARTPREEVRLLDNRAGLVARQGRRLDRFFGFLHRKSSREVFEDFMKKAGDGEPLEEGWLERIGDAQADSDAWFKTASKEYTKTRLANLRAEAAALKHKMAVVANASESGSKQAVVRALRKEMDRVEANIQKLLLGEDASLPNMDELLERYAELRNELDSVALRKAAAMDQAEKVGAVDIPLSAKQVASAVDIEFTQWERFYSDRRMGEMSRGKDLVPDEEFTDFLSDLKRGIREAYQSTDDGLYVDTRETICLLYTSPSPR